MVFTPLYCQPGI